SLEGTGFVYRPGRVMTNAHVVAGVDEPTVRIGETDYSGTVVSYDPAVDVAVIDVPDLPAPALDFASREARSGAPAAVLGFPENGPFDAQPARIRDRRTLRSPDIYGDDTVFRDTYSIRAVVRQGNSGGPLVDARGDVLGVIFAASVTDGDTAYALTARQVSEAALAGASASAGVDTGDCAL
ncbi:MAG TPA: MarP family serine protease, partial [Nocardioidaceae bacterium]